MFKSIIQSSLVVLIFTTGVGCSHFSSNRNPADDGVEETVLEPSESFGVWYQSRSPNKVIHNNNITKEDLTRFENLSAEDQEFLKNTLLTSEPVGEYAAARLMALYRVVTNARNLDKIYEVGGGHPDVYAGPSVLERIRVLTEVTWRVENQAK